MQANQEHVIVSPKVKQELTRRKIILEKHWGKKVSFNDVLKNILRM